MQYKAGWLYVHLESRHNVKVLLHVCAQNHIDAGGPQYQHILRPHNTHLYTKHVLT